MKKTVKKTVKKAVKKTAKPAKKVTAKCSTAGRMLTKSKLKSAKSRAGAYLGGIC